MVVAAGTMSAQIRHSEMKKSVGQERVAVYSDMNDVPGVVDYCVLDKNAPKTPSLAPSLLDGVPKAWFNRPDGCFYAVSYTVLDENGIPSSHSLYAPYIQVKPYATHTFENVSEDAERYEWEYQIYDRSAGAKVWETSDVKDLEIRYSQENDTAPLLTAFNSAGINNYGILGYNVSGDDPSHVYYSTLLSRVDYQRAYTNTADRHLWASSKFFAAKSDRNGSQTAGASYTIGAPDRNGGKTGRWLGRNEGVINRVAVAFEKPKYPYLLRNVGVRYQGFSLKDPTQVHEMKVTVYRLDEIPAYNKASIADETITPSEDDIVCTGTITMTKDYPAIGTLCIPLTVEDGGLVYDIWPEIDFPILIAFEGYQIDNIDDAFTLLQSSDYYDEGKGELAYLGTTLEDGTVEYYGAYAYLSADYKRGLSIFAEIELPFLIWNYTSETGEYNFDVAGEKREDVQIYGSYSFDEYLIYVGDDPDSEVPEWVGLTVGPKVEDGEESETIAVANFDVQPLPEGMAYRECDVTFKIPGASLVYKVTQGEKPDGIKGDVDGDGNVNVSDVTALVNMILDIIPKDMVKADINGDGSVNVSDVTDLVNLILNM